MAVLGSSEAIALSHDSLSSGGRETLWMWQVGARVGEGIEVEEARVVEVEEGAYSQMISLWHMWGTTLETTRKNKNK